MYQKTTIVGNLGRDPEMKYMPDGKAVTSFSVAVTKRWNDKNGNKQEKTTWFRVSVWDKQAEACNQYLSKGKKVLVEGELDSDAETGGPKQYQKTDGTVATSFEIRASTVLFLSAKSEGHSDDEATGHAATSPTPRVKETEDIPF